jgi:hypothetical protein
MFEMWMDIGGFCQKEFKMYMENSWRAPAIHPSTEVNFVKPPMVDSEDVKKSILMHHPELVRSNKSIQRMIQCYTLSLSNQSSSPELVRMGSNRGPSSKKNDVLSFSSYSLKRPFNPSINQYDYHQAPAPFSPGELSVTLVPPNFSTFEGPPILFPQSSSSYFHDEKQQESTAIDEILLQQHYQQHQLLRPASTGEFAVIPPTPSSATRKPDRPTSPVRAKEEEEEVPEPPVNDERIIVREEWTKNRRKSQLRRRKVIDYLEKTGGVGPSSPQGIKFIQAPASNHPEEQPLPHRIHPLHHSSSGHLHQNPTPSKKKKDYVFRKHAGRSRRHREQEEMHVGGPGAHSQRELADLPQRSQQTVDLLNYDKRAQELLNHFPNRFHESLDTIFSDSKTPAVPLPVTSDVINWDIKDETIVDPSNIPLFSYSRRLFHRQWVDEGPGRGLYPPYPLESSTNRNQLDDLQKQNQTTQKCK